MTIFFTTFRLVTSCVLSLCCIFFSFSLVSFPSPSLSHFGPLRYHSLYPAQRYSIFQTGIKRIFVLESYRQYRRLDIVPKNRRSSIYLYILFPLDDFIFFLILLFISFFYFFFFFLRLQTKVIAVRNVRGYENCRFSRMASSSKMGPLLGASNLFRYRVLFLDHSQGKVAIKKLHYMIE